MYVCMYVMYVCMYVCMYNCFAGVRRLLLSMFWRVLASQLRFSPAFGGGKAGGRGFGLRGWSLRGRVFLFRTSSPDFRDVKSAKIALLRASGVEIREWAGRWAGPLVDYRLILIDLSDKNATRHPPPPPHPRPALPPTHPLYGALWAPYVLLRIRRKAIFR